MWRRSPAEQLKKRMSSERRDPDARPTVPRPLAAAVMSSLFVHPHEDTPQAIAAAIGDPRITATEITEVLNVLGSGALVHTDGLHWQLSAAGYRKHREAAGPD